MGNLNFLTENWQLVSLFFGTAGGSGWIGYLLSSKSRKIDLQRKAFQLNVEMIDSLREDFGDRVKHLQEYINELDAIIATQKEIISKQKNIIRQYKKELSEFKK